MQNCLNLTQILWIATKQDNSANYVNVCPQVSAKFSIKIKLNRFVENHHDSLHNDIEASVETLQKVHYKYAYI